MNVLSPSDKKSRKRRSSSLETQKRARHRSRSRSRDRRRHRKKSYSSSTSSSRSRSRSRGSKSPSSSYHARGRNKYSSRREKSHRRRRSASQSPDTLVHGHRYYNDNENKPNNTIMFRNLPPDIVEADIQKELDKVPGFVREIRLMRHRDTGISRGFAFVEYFTIEDAVRFYESVKHKGSVLLRDEYRVPINYCAPRGEGLDKSEWICSQCAIANFKKRANCFKCNLRKEESDAQTNLGKLGISEMSTKPNKVLLIRGFNPLTTDETKITEAIRVYSYCPLVDIQMGRDYTTVTGKMSETQGYCFVEMLTLKDACDFMRILTQNPIYDTDESIAGIISRGGDGGTFMNGPLTIGMVNETEETTEGEILNENNRRRRSLVCFAKSSSANLALVGATVAHQRDRYHESAIAAQNTALIANAQHANRLLTSTSQLSKSINENDTNANICDTTNSAKNLNTGSNSNLTSTFLGTVQAVLSGGQHILPLPSGYGTEEIIYPVPDTSQYRLDPRSGYYYDPSTRLYYDPNTKYYYNGESGKFLYWCGERRNYLLVPPTDKSQQNSTGTTTITAQANVYNDEIPPGMLNNNDNQLLTTKILLSQAKNIGHSLSKSHEMLNTNVNNKDSSVSTVITGTHNNNSNNVNTVSIDESQRPALINAYAKLKKDDEIKETGNDITDFIAKAWKDSKDNNTGTMPIPNLLDKLNSNAQMILKHKEHQSHGKEPMNLESNSSKSILEQPLSKAEIEAREKTKQAQKIARDMEKWAKTQNVKKDSVMISQQQTTVPYIPSLNAGPTILVQTPHPNQNLSHAVVTNKEKSLAPELSNPQTASNSLNLLASQYGQSKANSPVINSTESAITNDKIINNSCSPQMLAVKREALNVTFLDQKLLACLLCKRQFNTVEVLLKHGNLSQLHKDNLTKYLDIQMKSTANNTVNNQPSLTNAKFIDILQQEQKQQHHNINEQAQQQQRYRDRAKERRKKHGMGLDEPPELSHELSIMIRNQMEAAAKTASQLKLPSAVSQIQKAQNVAISDDNIGSKMLKNMGWKSGAGLGKQGQGITEPIKAIDDRFTQKDSELGTAMLSTPTANLLAGGAAANQTVTQQRFAALSGTYQDKIRKLVHERFDNTS